MKSIYEFKKNDVVVRVEPSSIIGYSIMNPDGTRDRSYIGEKLIFVGVTNGCIYLKRTDEVQVKVFGDKLVELPLDLFSDGWEYYIDPNKLLELVDDNIIVSDEELRKQIELAVADENYEKADRLSKKLKNT